MSLFYNMRIGTKITIASTFVVLLSMVVLAFVIISHSSEILRKESNTLLYNSAKRSANLIQGYINESYAVLNAAQANTEDYIEFTNGQEIKEEILDDLVTNMVDKNSYGIYGYLYLKNTVVSPKLNLNGATLLMAYDNNPGGDGGVSVIKPDAQIISFRGFQDTLNSGKPSVGDARHINIDGKNTYVVAINLPIRDKKSQQIIGVIGMFLDFDALTRDIVESKRLSVFPNDYRMVVDRNARIIAHHNDSLEGQLLTDINRHKSAVDLAQAIKLHKDGEIIKYSNYRGQVSYGAVAIFNIWHDIDDFMGLIIVAPEDSILAPAHELRNYIILIVVMSILLISSLLFVIVKMSVISPIQT
ncbi:PDC sensor domain-containing protein, partial [Helicobacter aurati]